MQPSVQRGRLARLLAKHWKLRHPPALISVIGGSADETEVPLRLPARHRQLFGKGLVAAATATHALVMSGGIGSGVMELVGSALAEDAAAESIRLLGFVDWAKVGHRVQLQANRGESLPRHYSCSPYEETTILDDAEYPLEPRHTHYARVSCTLT